MRVGLYFGSFNPPHIGHTVIAEHMLMEMKADEVWMVVSPMNPFKESSDLLDEQERLRLVKRALGGHVWIKACDFEFDLPRPSYTIDTMLAMQEKHPEDEFFIIMGSDNMVQLKNWKEYEKLIDRFEIAVYPRPGYDFSADLLKELGGKITFSDAPLLEISSTAIRKAISKKEPCQFLMREAVWRAIERKAFYNDVL